MSLNRDISSVCLFFLLLFLVRRVKKNKMIVREQSRQNHFHYDINIQNLRFSSNSFREGRVGDHQPVRDVSKIWD